MINPDYARRRARGGTGKLPGNPRQWPYEHNGLDVRDDLGIDAKVALPVDLAYTLLPNVEVMPHGDVIMATSITEFFRGPGNQSWSGLATRAEDGSEFVLYNDAHPETRVRATLMEEFFHIRLDHPRSSVRLFGNDKESSRTFDSTIEEEAYASGAAALVPYCSLREMLGDEVPVSSIAESFKVSPKLVSYRIAVTRISRRTKRQRARRT